jgi:hypothetical protein
VNDQEAWVAEHAALIRRVLADPEVRADVLALLAGDDHQARRRRRLAELEQELARMEIRWRLGDDGP